MSTISSFPPSITVANKVISQPSHETEKSGADKKQAEVSKSELTSEDLEKVQELKLRDREVRIHEAAHLAAAGQYATSGAKFQFQRGADGKNYAVGGEVSIDTSPIPNNPEATIKKAQQLQAAARAPAEPSNQDRQVAASASKMAIEARAELAEQRQVDAKDSTEKAAGTMQNSAPVESKNDEKISDDAIKTYQEIDSSNSEESSKFLSFFV